MQICPWSRFVEITQVLEGKLYSPASKRIEVRRADEQTSTEEPHSYTRRNHTVIFETKVAFAALKGKKTLARLVQQSDMHANQIEQWMIYL